MISLACSIKAKVPDCGRQSMNFSRIRVALELHQGQARKELLYLMLIPDRPAKQIVRTWKAAEPHPLPDRDGGAFDTSANFALGEHAQRLTFRRGCGWSWS